jgi:hypothetical protein
LVERWNGTSWSIVTSPSPSPGTTDAVLIGVACPSKTSCYAVGHYATDSARKTLVEHWNGTSWSIVTGPDPIGGFLSGVSCPSKTSCYAVGGYSTKTVVEPWNGTSWSIVTTPNPTGANLSAVSCRSKTSCYAVGNYSTDSAPKTLVERWNGTSWSIVTSPNPAGATYSDLTGVSCPSKTSCSAVGFFYTDSSFNEKTLVENWNGTSWSIVTSPPDPSGRDAHVIARPSRGQSSGMA